MSRKKETTMSESHQTIWKTAIYVRLSKEDGNDVSYSVINQKKRLMCHVETMASELELVDVYVDDGYTGTDSDRDSFQRLLEDIRNKKINCVIVKDPSRLSRNYIEAGQYMEQFFVMHDVRFISLELPSLDSYKYPEQMNSIAVPIQNVFNDDFCRQTSIKIRGVFDNKRSRGEFIGAFAPYGYKKDPEDYHHLIIDEETAPIVRDIFHWYVCEQLSKNKIVIKLNELGIPNPTQYKKEKGLKYCNPKSYCNDGLWGHTTISNILQNQCYIGDMVQGRYKIKSYKVHTQYKTDRSDWFIVEGMHKPIIERDIFHKAQELNKRETRTAFSRSENYLFSGFLRCGDCKKAMYRKQSGKYGYYFCSTYGHKSKTKCTKHTVNESKLEGVVLKVIQQQINVVADLQKTISQIQKSGDTNKKSTRLEEMHTKRVKEFEKQKYIHDNLYMDWKNGDLTQDQYRRMNMKLKATIQQLEESIKTIESEKEELRNGIKKDNPYFKTFLQQINIDKLNRLILSELVDHILIYENNEIEVIFNYQDQYSLILDYIEANKKNKYEN